VPHPSYALKQELMWIPVINLYFKRMGTVSIRRNAGASAVKNLIQGARRIMAEKRPLVIFPEGTRAISGKPGQYQVGIAALYRDLNVPVVPVALNSGLFWGRRSPIKHPGEITVKFLPPILPGLSRTHFMTQLVDSIEGACAQLNKEAV
jgi:1-acyl-sn-glycerol-3-phosphate acyltransferase